VSAGQAGKSQDEGDDSARHYVNAFTASVSLSSIEFDLAALGVDGEGKDRVWRFITAPSRFQSFHLRMGEAIAKYCTQFGEIASPESDGPDRGWSGRHG
jgi:hypothetical protein